MITLGKVISFVRTLRRGVKLSDVKTSLGANQNVTPEHMGGCGDDNHPLPDDYVALVSVPRNGGFIAVAYLDPKNLQKAQAGDRRSYARNVAGDQVGEVWIKNTGEITTNNANGEIKLAADGGTVITSPEGSIELAADGAIDLKQGDDNEVTIATDGTITAKNALGTFKILPSGFILMNGVTIDILGNITTLGLITSGTTVLSTHVHTLVTAGLVNSGPPA